MIVVTGAAGFIGSVVVWRLNQAGITDIWVVDDADISDRKDNLRNKRYSEYLDKGTFMARVRKDDLPASLTAIIHMGACSSTLEQNADYLNRNNFLYTRDLAIYCVNHGVQFLYASSAATYGEGENGYVDSDENTLRLKPLNLYGKSKQDFDVWALKNNYLNKITGFKFFNVYGPNEYHKAEMRSIIAKSYHDVLRDKKIKLFKSYLPEYPHGGQKRDFVYVKDAVEVVKFFLDHPEKCGLFNVGTGRAQSWNELAEALFLALDLPLNIEYIEMPEVLRPRYQYFTEADLTKLRSAGFVRSFSDLRSGLADYCDFLKDSSTL